MKIKNVDFTNIPNKLGTGISTKIVQSNIGDLSREEYINSQNFYKLFSAIDIDWNGIVIDENITINDTADLINVILSMKQEIDNLKDKITDLEGTMEAVYDTDDNGNMQLYNPGE